MTIFYKPHFLSFLRKQESTLKKNHMDTRVREYDDKEKSPDTLIRQV